MKQKAISLIVLSALLGGCGGSSGGTPTSSNTGASTPVLVPTLPPAPTPAPTPINRAPSDMGSTNPPDTVTTTPPDSGSSTHPSTPTPPDTGSITPPDIITPPTPSISATAEVDESYCLMIRTPQTGEETRAGGYHCDPSIFLDELSFCRNSPLPCTPTLPTEPAPRPDEPIPTPHILGLANTPTARKQVFEDDPTYKPRINGVTSTQLSMINAADAYAKGWTGHGQVIAIVDTGFHTDHLSLRGEHKTVHHLEFSGPRVVETDDPETDENEMRNDFKHGTAVAAVAAGNRGDGAMHGVAFDARLNYRAYTEKFSLISNFSANNVSGLINLPRDGRIPAADRAFIVNISWGPPFIITSRTPTQYNDLAKVIGQSHMLFHGAFAQNVQFGTGLIPINRADADKSLVVFAAGNNRGKSEFGLGVVPLRYDLPQGYASLPYVFPELKKNVLAVVAVDNDGIIASYSNRCGIAKDFCIAAPGNLLTADYSFNDDTDLHLQDDHYSKKNGTSFAAPTVSGALAVLRQKFGSQMGNTELVARLKATADNTNYTALDPADPRDYSNSDIYGAGLLDLGAAVNDPVGGVEMDGMALQTNSFTPGFSFGDALQTAFSGQLVTGFDQLLTPFEYHLGGFVKNQTPSSLNPLRAFHQDWHRRQNAENGANSGFGAAGFALNSASEGSSSRIISNPNSHLTLAQGGVNFALKPRNGIAFSLFNTAKKDGTPTAAGLSFAWQKTANFGLGGGILRENEMALQSRGEGVFGGLNANTFFFGIAAKKHWRNWQFHAGAEAGAVFVDGDHWLDDVSTLLTSSLSADAVKKFNDRNTLRLGISSPLRVEHGDANLTLPAGRTRYRELLHRKITPSLVPTGRQIDLTATWSRKLPLSNARVYASLRNSYQPGHRKTADSEVSALISLELDF